MKNFDNKPAIRLLKLFCPEEMQEEIIGDLEEQYEQNKTQKPDLIASALLLYNILRFLRLGIIKRRNMNQLSTFLLIGNFTKVFFRSAKKHFSFYSINLIGTTIGLTVALFTLIYVQNETSYDSFHTHSKDIYRVVGKRTYGAWFPHISIKHSKPIKDGQFSWASKPSRLSRVPIRYVTVGNERFSESKALVIESGDPFFSLFDFELIYGPSPQSVTETNNSVILTHSTSKKYFGNENPLGKTVLFDSVRVTVSGVMEDLPTNTHLDFNMLLVSDEYFATKSAALIYFLKGKTEKQRIIDDIIDYAKNAEGRNTLADADLQNVQDIHLHSNLTFELKPGGNPDQLSIFILIAATILLISSTNFTNISTAVFSKRRKEMAVRKVLGSNKSNLTIQFLFESILISLVSVPFVFLIAIYLLPYFNDFTGIDFTSSHLFALETLLLVFGISALTGFLGGIYPSMVMPRISALLLFKNDTKPGKLHLRKVLVTLQFALLVGLGTSSFFINKQLNHISNLETGFDKEGLIKVKRAWDIEGPEKIKAIKNELAVKSFIISVSEGQVPGDEDYPMKYKIEGIDDVFNDALSIPTDHNYLKTLDIEGKYGPYFSEDEHPGLSLLVNESFVRENNWDNPIGKTINTRPNDENGSWIPIRGVFSDFNFFSLHQEVTPIFLFLREERQYMNRNILIRINLSQAQEAFEWIENVWNQYMPDTPLEYAFVDEDMQAAYIKDQKTAKISTFLSILAIIIAVMGLVGMTAFMTTLKTKEIGVRKILGASKWDLLAHFNREYILLVLIATLVATSISFYFLENWIQEYAYRIEITPFYFILSGIALLLVTFLTVSAESLRVIKENPVKALRQE